MAHYDRRKPLEGDRPVSRYIKGGQSAGRWGIASSAGRWTQATAGGRYSIAPGANRWRMVDDEGGASDPFVFHAPMASALSNLSTSLTINSQTKTPDLFYLGQDYDGTDWTATVGLDLVLGGAGDPPLVKTAPTTDPADGSAYVDRSAGIVQYLENTTGSYGAVALEDMVVELVWYGTPDTHWIIQKRGAGPYWAINNDSSGQFQLLLSDGGAPYIILASFEPNTWNHAMAFVDRSGSGAAYVNGVIGTPISVAACGTITNTDPFRMCRTSGGTGQYAIAQHAMWKGTDWLDTHLQADVAAARYAAVSGLAPSISSANKWPVVSTRASAAHLERYNTTLCRRELHPVGDHWLRSVADYDPVANQLIKGYLAEPAGTNLAAVDLTTWTLADAGDSLAATDRDDSVIFNGQAQELTADSTNGAHGLTDTATLTAAAYVLSVYCKPGAAPWYYVSDDTVPTAFAYFDQWGNAGTVGAAASATARPMGDGRHRLEIAFTGTAATHTVRLAVCDADGTSTYSLGDGATVAGTFEAPQLELGSEATSFMAAARSADRLDLPLTDTEWAQGKGTLTCEVMPTGLNGRYLRPEESSADYIRMERGSGLHFSTGVSGSLTQWTIFGSALNSGKLYELGLNWDTNDVEVFLDKASEGTDSSSSGPVDFATLYVGHNSIGSGQTGAIISNVRMYNVPQAIGDIASLLIGAGIMSYGELSVSTSLTVDVSVAGAPAKLGSKAGATAAGELLNFTHTSPGRLTYTGAATKKFHIDAAITAEADTINTNSYFYLAKNGTTLAKSQIRRLISTATDQGAMPLTAVIELATSDYIEVFCDADKTAELAVDFMNLNCQEIA